MNISKYNTYTATFFNDGEIVLTKEVSNASTVVEILANAPRRGEITNCVIANKSRKYDTCNYIMWSDENGIRHYRAE